MDLTTHILQLQYVSPEIILSIPRKFHSGFPIPGSSGGNSESIRWQPPANFVLRQQPSSSFAREVDRLALMWCESFVNTLYRVHIYVDMSAAVLPRLPPLLYRNLLPRNPLSSYRPLRMGRRYRDDKHMEVPYDRDLEALEDALAAGRRPGDFFVRGVLETPMRRFEIEGAGVISFPIPDSQIQDIIKRAERAPYGRGCETILDTSVRNAWQLAPTKVRIGGKSWERSFQQILATVTNGLGCAGMNTSAELYKLLIYEEGGFFLPHRDTEKTDGMFGTLTIVLPSVHCGGELVIRHTGREVTVDLSNAEASELTFAAFYADCEHSIKPITQGSRVCLTYNLLQRGTGKKNKPITAPLYDREADRAGAILEQTFEKPDAPAKLAWLLEHHYTPVGLSFSGLKARDAALAKVVRDAARRARCALHLGIVHIEESGEADPYFA